MAWIGIVSSTPPSIGISLKDNRYSLKLLRKTKKFTVNLPSADKFKEVDYCGITTGEKFDQFSNCGFSPIDSKHQLSKNFLIILNAKLSKKSRLEIGTW